MGRSSAGPGDALGPAILGMVVGVGTNALGRAPWWAAMAASCGLGVLWWLVQSRPRQAGSAGGAADQ